MEPVRKWIEDILAARVESVFTRDQPIGAFVESLGKLGEVINVY